jgi:hypothetical protein
MTTKAERLIRLAQAATRYGLSAEHLEKLLRAEETLHRWAELECGDSGPFASWAIERDEETDKPFRVVYPHSGPSYHTPIRDREAGAKRRVAAILTHYPELCAIYQGDPRGCALRIARRDEIGKNPDSYSGGLAICL